MKKVSKSALVNSPTELTTAVTDVVLAVLALLCSLTVLDTGQTAPWKADLWGGAFGLLALSGVLGAIAHGFKMPGTASRWLWHALYLILGLIVGLFVVGVIYDGWGETAARWSLPVMVSTSLIFFSVTLLKPDTFVVFIVYETAAMIFALVVYGSLTFWQTLDGAGLMTLGILITLVAGAVQATKTLSFTLIWPFDHNGLYHLLQMAGIIFLTAGLWAGF